MPPSSRNKIAAPRGPPLTVPVAGDAACPSAAFASPTRPRWARPCKPKGNHMSNIGSFTKQEDGFAGTLRTLAFNDKAPDYRVFAGVTEIGAAWKRQSKANKAYLSVRLDDPSLAAPVNARLVDGEDGSTLYWTRRDGD